MSNFSDFVSSSGGGGASFTASTALAKNPVVAGEEYYLDEGGNLQGAGSIPLFGKAVHIANPIADLLGIIDDNPDYVPTHGDRLTPDGRYFIYGGKENSSGDAHIVTTSGGLTPISSLEITSGGDHSSNRNIKLFYLHGDSTYHYYGAMRNTTSSFYVITFRIEISSGELSNYQVVKNTTTSAELTHVSESNYWRSTIFDMKMARNNTVMLVTIQNSQRHPYVLSCAMSGNTPSNISSMTRLGSYAITSNLKGLSSKYDDATGNFIVFGQDSSGVTIDKILVASNGSHAVTNIVTNNALLSNGISATALYCETSTKGRYAAVRANGASGFETQIVTYNGSSVAASDFSSFNLPVNDRYMAAHGNNTASVTNMTCVAPAIDRVFFHNMSQGQQMSLNSHPGIALDLSSGAVKFAGQVQLTSRGHAIQSNGQYPSYLEVQLNCGSSLSFGVNTQADNEFVPLVYFAGIDGRSNNITAFTKDKVAIARETKGAGETVAIDLQKGSTASAALANTKWVTKSDLSFPIRTGSYEDTDSAVRCVQHINLYLANGTSQMRLRLPALNLKKCHFSWVGFMGDSYMPNGTPRIDYQSDNYLQITKTAAGNYQGKLQVIQYV